jgi:hypothetical protein
MDDEQRQDRGTPGPGEDGGDLDEGAGAGEALHRDTGEREPLDDRGGDGNALEQRLAESDALAGSPAPGDGFRVRPPDAAPEPGPHTKRYNRKWFLVLGGAVMLGLVGVLEAFRRTAGSSGGATGGAARSLSNIFSSFPVNAVEEIPHKTLDQWTVRVDGLVDNPLTLDAAAWRALPRFEETVDFHCVEGWGVDNLKWGGVTPAAVLKEAKVRPGAAWVVFHAYTGEYTDTVPMDLALDAQTVLADTLDGKPLPAEHGGPLRLAVPKQLGYKSVKWVTHIEVTEKPVTGYWETRGYPADAPIRS